MGVRAMIEHSNPTKPPTMGEGDVDASVLWDWFNRSEAVDEANTAPPNVDMFIALNHETTRVFAISILLYSITHPHQTSSS